MEMPEKGSTQGSKVSVGSVDMEQKDEPVKTRRKKTYLLKKNIAKVLPTKTNNLRYRQKRFAIPTETDGKTNSCEY